MLQFTQNNVSDEIVVTLNEFVTISNPNYLFVFTHVETRRKVKFVKLFFDDVSAFQERYNQFGIDTSTVFDGEPTGEWHYKVYEQESTTNTDESLTGGLLENGKMMLLRETEFAPVEYDVAFSLKSYNG